MTTPITMKLNIREATIKIKLISETERKHENILADAFVTFKEEEGGYFTVSGFKIWKSKFEGGGLNVTVPRNKHFEFCKFEPAFWRRLKLEIIKAYEYEEIPIIG